ncbi:prepilin-type N-terminal cleavage/methylation domain-containing protein, partial [Escherichia coli]
MIKKKGFTLLEVIIV